MGQSVSNLAGVALRVYDTVVHSQVFSKNVLFQNILRNVAKEQGATTKYFSVKYDRNIGSAAGTETVTLPLAGNQQTMQASIPMKYNFHTVQITDVALKASKKSKEFLVDALEDEYKGAKEDMQRQLSRQGYGTGTGVICQVNDASPDTTLTFDNPMVGKIPTDYFSIGNAVMFSDSATSESSAAYTTISAITGDYTMTVASATGISDDDYVYLAHNAASPNTSNVNNELTGLKALIDDGTNLVTLEGISRTSYIWWKSYVDSSSSQRSLTDELMQTTFLKAQKKGDVKYGLTHFDVTSAYGQMLTPDRRYTDTMEIKGGFRGVTFNNIPLIADYDAPYDELYFIDPSTLSVEDLDDMKFLDSDGSVLDRSSTQPIWQATLTYYANLANKAPNKSAVLRDVIK